MNGTVIIKYIEQQIAPLTARIQQLESEVTELKRLQGEPKPNMFHRIFGPASHDSLTLGSE